MKLNVELLVDSIETGATFLTVIQEPKHRVNIVVWYRYSERGVSLGIVSNILQSPSIRLPGCPLCYMGKVLCFEI